MTNSAGSHSLLACAAVPSRRYGSWLFETLTVVPRSMLASRHAKNTRVSLDVASSAHISRLFYSVSPPNNDAKFFSLQNGEQDLKTSGCTFYSAVWLGSATDAEPNVGSGHSMGPIWPLLFSKDAD
jgi:hypothetical protein